MGKSDRDRFMDQFYQLPDFFALVEMFDLIGAICLSTGKSVREVKARFDMGLWSAGENRNLYSRLQGLAVQTHAWPVRDENGLYRIERRVFEARVMHIGWELDNLAWVVDDGSQRMLRTTSHSGECEMTQKELFEKIKETKASLDELKHAAKMMGWL